MSFSVIDFIDQLVEGPPKITGGSTRHDMSFGQAAEYFDRLGLRYELEERAAILEYDGGLDRYIAENQAVREILERNI